MSARRKRYIQFVGSGLTKSGGDLLVDFSSITTVGTLTSLKVSGATVAGGSAAAHVSSALDVQSTSKGLLLPRLTTVQRNAISSPVNGLLVYNSTTNKVQARAGGAWVDLH